MCPHALFGKPSHTLIPQGDAKKPGECETPDDLLRGLLRADNATLTIPNAPPKIITRCRRLILANLDYFSATGNWGLYFAYPLVYWNAPRAANPYWAPLFFWKIRVRFDKKGRLTIERYPGIGDEAEPPAFNRLLASRLNHDEHITIDMPDEYKDENIPWEELPGAIKATLSQWEECQKEEHFVPHTLRDFASWGDNNPVAAVSSFASLGFGKFAYQSVLGDLDKLSEKTDDASNMGCLGTLVSPVDGKNESPAESPGDREKYIVTTTDTSQERAIWQAKKSRLTIVQGPPGTGKSQTIVNLIADELARGNSRIAVICHHIAALSVVKRRLDACGEGEDKLSKLAVLITAPQTNRQEVIKSIRDIGQDDAPILNAAMTAREAARKVIEEAEKPLDELNRQLRGDSNPAHRYGALRAVFDNVKTKTGFDIYNRSANRDFRAAVDGVFPAEFTKSTEGQKKALIQYVNDYQECDYGDAPWKISRGKAEDIIAPEMEAALNEVREFFDTNSNNHNSLHRSPVFAEHPILLKHFPGFSVNPGFARKYARTLNDARNDLSAILPQAKISRMFAEFRKSGDSPMLEKCLRHYKKWAAFLMAHKYECENRRLIDIIAAKCPARELQWKHYFDAAIAWNIYRQLPNIPADSASNAEKQNKVLAKAIKEKEKQDALTVVGGFSGRYAAQDSLLKAGLLRLRGGPGGRKSQLRDIYHWGAQDMSEIYPVLLATPDAACQMLPLEPGYFDLLIIDEASQVFTSDALPLLYRAKRAVISGDKMQMAPSDFFTFSGADSDDGDAGDGTYEPSSNTFIPADGVYDLLSAVENARDSTPQLLVHYRAAARELIDFSNCAFYGDLKIPTGATKAPEFMRDGRPINLVQVDNGEFGKDGINRDEIRAIIQQLRNIWGSEPDAPQKYSVGVIVFNVTQRDALLDALERTGGEFGNWLKQSYAFKGDDGEEAAFFVRSVEHVQGDERDIIIMATTYDNNSGNNFGRINDSKKGRRRLNVAVSRAKQGMIVVTSLDIGRIAHKRESIGDDTPDRWFFWKYMQYAQAVSDGNDEGIAAALGDLPQFNKTQAPTGEADNAFEEQIGDFIIRECGYEIAYQVGEGEFRIDIGVKAKNGRFFCGVECDGATYHSDWNARHRDVWRQDVLEKKGWKIARVWSTEWFLDKASAQKKLQTALAKAAEMQNIAA